MNELSKEKVMTIAEVAEVLGVSVDTIQNNVKVLMPTKMKKGVTTYLDESEVTAIKIKLKGVDLRKVSEVGQTELERRMIVQSAIQIMQEDIELLTKENAQLKQENQLLLPKGEFYDAVMTSDTAMPMNEVAKMLGTGRTRLFSFLREKGVLMQGNLPYQKYSEYFEVKETPVLICGEVEMKPTTLVTQKGIDYIRKLLDKECNICYT